jgi:hypothetical protein
MRAILIPVLAASTLAAADNGPGALVDAAAGQAERSAELSPPDVELPRSTRPEVRLEIKEDRDCGDTITQAREEAGKPPLLDREPASPDKPQLIYAVDKRVDGCDVMVMKGDPADMRPLPKAADGPPVIVPLNEGR